MTKKEVIAISRLCKNNRVTIPKHVRELLFNTDTLYIQYSKCPDTNFIIIEPI